MVTRKDLNHDQTEMQDQLRYRYRINEIARNRNPEKLREKNPCLHIRYYNKRIRTRDFQQKIWSVSTIQTLNPEAQNAAFCSENMQIRFLYLHNFKQS